MSDLEARIAEVLEEHTAKRPWSDSGVMKCTCGERFVAEFEPHLHHLHRAHLTAMLAPVIAEHVAEEAFATITAYVEAWPGFRTGWGHDPESNGARAIANKTVTWLRARWKDASP